jgi:TM2 domain-containing membrane protein YozV
MTEQKPAQKKMIMILICWFAGPLGIHRMMMGYSNWWIQTITFGGCFVWSFIDLVKLVMGTMKMADGRDLL